MKKIKFLIIGILFGIILSKAEVISWYRIYEMFKFQSFHMYGVIGSAVILGVIVMLFININSTRKMTTMLLIKRGVIKSYQGTKIDIEPKKKGVPRNILGGIIFGLGWGLIGACPGPMFILLGRGVLSIIVVIFGGLLGVLFYHLIKNKLPH